MLYDVCADKDTSSDEGVEAAFTYQFSMYGSTYTLGFFVNVPTKEGESKNMWSVGLFGAYKDIDFMYQYLKSTANEGDEKWYEFKFRAFGFFINVRGFMDKSDAATLNIRITRR